MLKSFTSQLIRSTFSKDYFDPTLKKIRKRNYFLSVKQQQIEFQKLANNSKRIPKVNKFDYESSTACIRRYSIQSFFGFSADDDSSKKNELYLHHDLDQLEQIYPQDDAKYAINHVSELYPVLKVEEFLLWIHSSGIPWWSTIIVATIGLRTLILPFTIFLLKNSMRMKKITPQLKELNKIMKSGEDPNGTLAQYNYEENSAQSTTPVAEGFKNALGRTLFHEEKQVIESVQLKRKIIAAKAFKDLLTKSKCHPLNNWIIPFIFPPLVLSVFGAVHNLSIAEPSMTNGGALWFPDLVASDPTFLLPAISGAMWIWVVECAAGVHYFAWPNVKSSARVIALAFIPVTSILPSSIFIFWITSNLYAVIQSYILRIDKVRHVLGIPLGSEINYGALIEKKSTPY